MELNTTAFMRLKEKGLTHSKATALTVVYSALKEAWENQQTNELQIVASEFVKTNPFLPQNASHFRNYLHDLHVLGLINKKEIQGKGVKISCKLH